MDIRGSYDSAARAYAKQLSNELDHKPLDRYLLCRFAEEVRDLGVVLDVGCGPGHVTAYLNLHGATAIGVDLSAAMVACAAEAHPDLEFTTGDMRKLDFPDASVAGVVSFYSIVHFGEDELVAVFRELRRVLRKGGVLLVAFHAGKDVVHVDELFGAPVSLDFRFHDPDAVIEALRLAALTTIERSERDPYPDAEYPSRRCYLLAKGT